MNIEVNQIGKVILEGEEITQFYRLLKNECEGAEIAEGTTHAMYMKLRRFFDSI